MSYTGLTLRLRHCGIFAVLLSFTIGGPTSSANAQNVNHGETFHRSDREVRYVSAWFRDVKATTIRRSGTVVETVLEDANGLTLAHAVASSTTLSLSATLSGQTEVTKVRAQLETGSQYATDWFGVQLRVLWSEDQALKQLGDRALRELVWEGRFLRIKGHQLRRLQGRVTDPLTDEVLAVRTQYDDGIFAFGQKEAQQVRTPRTAYPQFTTRLFRSDGVTIGLLRYYHDPRVVTWSFSNGNEGVAPEWRVPGGFNFNPSLGWAGVQAMIFHRSRDENGHRVLFDSSGTPSVAETAWKNLGRAISNVLTSVSSLISVPLEARQACDHLSDGCNGLHWLDGTIFRECCDTHDLCFEMNCDDVCTKVSWIWPFGQWDCALCNFEAVLCFATGGGGGGDDGGGGGGNSGGSGCNDGDVCTRCERADFCPAECQSCSDPT